MLFKVNFFVFQKIFENLTVEVEGSAVVEVEGRTVVQSLTDPHAGPCWSLHFCPHSWFGANIFTKIASFCES